MERISDKTNYLGKRGDLMAKGKLGKNWNKMKSQERCYGSAFIFSESGSRLYCDNRSIRIICLFVISVVTYLSIGDSYFVFLKFFYKVLKFGLSQRNLIIKFHMKFPKITKFRQI
jgi:hypothetical protein